MNKYINKYDGVRKVLSMFLKFFYVKHYMGDVEDIENKEKNDENIEIKKFVVGIKL